MKFRSASAMIFAVLAFFATCGLKQEKPKPPGEQAINPTILVPITAVLRETGNSADVFFESKVDVKPRIRFISEFKDAQFADANNGWAGSSKDLYRTSNGGKHWRQLTLNLDTDTRISSFFFRDGVNGWLTTVTQKDVDRYGLGNSSRIMATTDGGESWREQAAFADEVIVTSIRFLDANQGIAIGSRVNDKGPPVEQMFAIRTSDGGKTWNDISERLKLAVENTDSIPGDAVVAVGWPTPSRLLLLLRSGKIIGSSDRGETWTAIVHYVLHHADGSLLITGYRGLVLDASGRIMVIAGAEGDEGYRGDLIASDNASWTSHKLTRISIRAAVFVSNTDVIACGFQVYPYDEASKTQQTPTGIILHSADRGKTWAVVYRSRSDEAFFSLSKVSRDQIYAIGSYGSFVSISLKDA